MVEVAAYNGEVTFMRPDGTVLFTDYANMEQRDGRFRVFSMVRNKDNATVRLDDLVKTSDGTFRISSLSGDTNRFICEGAEILYPNKQ